MESKNVEFGTSDMKTQRANIIISHNNIESSKKPQSLPLYMQQEQQQPQEGEEIHPNPTMNENDNDENQSKIETGPEKDNDLIEVTEDVILEENNGMDHNSYEDDKEQLTVHGSIQDDPQNSIENTSFTADTDNTVAMAHDTTTSTTNNSSEADHENAQENTMEAEEQNDTPQNDLLSELQQSLQNQMAIRAEAEHKIRMQNAELDSYKEKLQEYSKMEDEVEKLRATLQQFIAEKSRLEQEVETLRNGREDLEQKEIVLNNRLNEAKKAEANKSNVAGRLESENIRLSSELNKVKEEWDLTQKQKEKLESSMEKLKLKCVERVKMVEAALIEERNLNDERKKKMKVFVETKAEELRVAKGTSDELRSELKETKEALLNVRGKLEHVTKQHEIATTKNRELTRELNRMKKSSEQVSLGQVNLEMELHKSAQETEEHKNKRLTAKHELMTILRKLETEQAVSAKLRDSVKFTFTPKALSQQQLLNENLQDFESQLLKLSRRLGKALPPSLNRIENEDDSYGYGDDRQIGMDEANGDNEDENAASGTQGKKKISRSEWDTSRLVSTLDQETQKVSKAIMSFSNAVERMQSLLDDSGERTCVSTLNEMFSIMAASRTDSLAGRLQASERHDEDEDGFAGSPVKGRNHDGSYHGLIQQK